MWIVVLSNIQDGFKFYGPFATEEKAWKWEHPDSAYPNETSAEAPDFQVIKLAAAH